jgi:hypothetical protein
MARYKGTQGVYVVVHTIQTEVVPLTLIPVLVDLVASERWSSLLVLLEGKKCGK